MKLSAHATARMAERGITLAEVQQVLKSGRCAPDAAPAGKEPRWRWVGRTSSGRALIIVVAGERSTGTLVTVFEAKAAR